MFFDRISLASMLGIALALSMLATPVHATAEAGVTVTRPPEDRGPAFVPGVRLVENLPQAYVEEEFFVSGESTLYNYANDPPQGPTDIVPIETDVPYTTRLIVRRPENPKRFNGTVVIEWWNSTAGFDTAPVWDPSAEYFAKRGIIYIGVTNSTTALDFLTDGCSLLGFLPPACGTRYADLSLPENGLAYEMMSQIAKHVKQRPSDGIIPPDYRVKRVLHTGESQQAGSVVTYASAFHVPGVNDGYMIQSGINARPINFGTSCEEEGAPAFPDCTPRLVFPDSLVRTDLPVPVYQVVTQTDFETLRFGTRGRQDDTRFYRYYEVAGGAHSTVHKDIEIIPAGVFGPAPILLEDLCDAPINTTADGPVFVNHFLNALWQRMQEQVAVRWLRPPPGRVMDDIDGALVRDDNNNVTGGVRLPSMEAPVATYVSTNSADPTLPPILQNIGNLACRLSGSVVPFEEATLDELYPRPRSYFGDVLRSVLQLYRERMILLDDAIAVLWDAIANPVGGGSGE